ncbi:lyase family protein [Streptomyces sp. H27-C3]|uniref:lyase family protein n=1 Tax=Streptomyces sp. H27-C3 TaxID=3046305 RepID=UPI0024B90FBE|nr:lyase family protein [Streptomyces sp. H27-C3]MDJ0464483.1 lyase family protein [Streptomyces sp. H27-C3]
MISPDADHLDQGLLSPVRAGTAAEAATGDPALLQAMLDAEAALTRAQGPRWAADAVAAVARADRFDVRDLALRARPGGNPVIPLVADLTAAAGEEAGEYVHRGATSQDIIDTAMMLVATRTLPCITADLTRTAEALAILAREHRDTPMPGRTLTQHAVPTTFGLKAAGWRSLVLDAQDRLRALRLPAQLGGAAGTLAGFAAPTGPHEGAPEERAAGTPAPIPATSPLALVTAYAEELALPAPHLPWHTLRTPITDLGTALAFTCVALGKFATDIRTLARTEIAEVTEATSASPASADTSVTTDTAPGTSSAMPHKANPVHATLVTSAAQQAPALAATLLGSLAAAEDERPAGAWHAEWQPLRELLRLAGGAADHAADLAEGLRVHPTRMHENLGLTDGLIVSERIAAALAPALGRARAKQLLTAASRRAAAEGIPLAEALADTLPATELAELTELTEPAELAELTDPTGYTGSAAALVDRALERAPEAPHA